jgi:hypothetical protein
MLGAHESLKPAGPKAGGGLVLTANAPGDGSLTAKQIKTLRKDAAKHLPKGKMLFKAVLFE